MDQKNDILSSSKRSQVVSNMNLKEQFGFGQYDSESSFNRTRLIQMPATLTANTSHNGQFKHLFENQKIYTNINNAPTGLRSNRLYQDMSNDVKNANNNNYEYKGGPVLQK